MELTLYSLGKGEAKEEKKATIQIGGKETAEQALGISAKKLNLSKLDWKNLMVQGIPNQQLKPKRKIRKLPSASQCVGSPYSKRALNLSSICRNDRKRNSYHYGNRRGGGSYLGQIRIWTRLDRPWIHNAGGWKCRINSCFCQNKHWDESRWNKSWKFLKCSGSLENKYGTSIEFDAQGIVKVNGSAVNGVQFSGFYFKEGNLHGVSRMPGATNETPILFIPSREGGSESIYWSKSDATNGNDLYYRVD